MEITELQCWEDAAGLRIIIWIIGALMKRLVLHQSLTCVVMDDMDILDDVMYAYRMQRDRFTEDDSFIH